MNTNSKKILLASDCEGVDQSLAAMRAVGAFSVYHFGGDVIRRQKVQHALPQEATLVDMTGLLNSSADLLEECLLNIEEQVYQDKSDLLAWESSLVADRSPYAGDLQLNAARYLVLEAVVSKGGSHLFLIDDVGAGQALAETAKLNCLGVQWIGKRRSKSVILKALRARLSVLKTALTQSYYLKKLRIKRPLPLDELRDSEVLVLDWASPRSFSRDGHTTRVGKLGRMPQLLRGEGFRVAFVANPISWISSHKGIADNAVFAKDPVIMLDDLRGVFSVLKGAWATWRMNNRLRRSFKFENKDLSPLFELERRRDVCATQPISSYTYSEIGKTLAKWGVFPKAIVYPFENQGLERALIHGVRQYLPHTKICGYQHTPFSPRYLGFFHSKKCVNEDRIPDCIMVMGEYFKSLYLSKGYPVQKLSVVGALNFEALLDMPANKRRDKSETKNILCATSVEFNDSLNLIAKTILASKNLGNVSLVVNFHPVVDEEFRNNIIKITTPIALENNISIEFSNKSSSQLIQSADALLYNNSGSVFEAKIVGVPSIYVSVDGRISYDKVPDEVSLRTLTIDELRDSMATVFAGYDADVAANRSVGGCIEGVSSTQIRNAIL